MFWSGNLLGRGEQVWRYPSGNALGMSADLVAAQSDELLSVLEQLPEGVFVLDAESRVVFANKPGLRLVKMKPKKTIGEPFPYPLEDGTMRDFDVEMLVRPMTWGGRDAKLVHLKPLKSAGAFHLEWKLESALEKARSAELMLEEWKSREMPAVGAPSSDGSADLERQLAETRDQLQAAQSREAELSSRLDDYEARMAQQRSEFEDRQSELESLLELAETRADELQNQVVSGDHQSATELQHAVSLARDAEDQLRGLEQELSEARDRIRVAEEQAEVAEERAYSLETELESLSAEMDQRPRSEELEALQAELEALRSQQTEGSDRSALEAEVAELAQRLEARDEELAILTDRVEAKEEELAALASQLQARDQALGASSAKQQELEAVQQQAQAKDAKLAELRAQLQAKDGELTGTREQLQARDRELSELSERLQAREGDLGGLDGQLQAREGELSALSAQLQNRDAEIATLQERLQAGQSELGTAKADLESKTAELSAVTAQFQAKEAELLALTEQLQGKGGELAGLAEGLRDKDEQISALNAQLASKDTELTGLRAELAAQTARLDAEAEGLEAVSSSLEALKAELEVARGDGRATAEALDAAQAEVDDLKARLEEAEETLRVRSEESDELAEQLRAETELSEETVAHLREENERLHDRVSELEPAAAQVEQLQKEVQKLTTQLEGVGDLAEQGERADKLERKLEGALRRAEEAEERLQEERRLLTELRQTSERRISELEARGGRAGATPEVDPETERMAFQDPLTGLPNRNILHRYLGFMLQQSVRYERYTALLRIDCDKFKVISDTFGADVGDRLIRLVGERLSAVVRSSDVLGRLSEDEFVILLSELTDQKEASVVTASVIKRIYHMLKKPFSIDEQSISVSVSIGVSLYPLDAANGEQMFQHSAEALKRAKETGRGQAQYYTPEVQSSHEARLQLDHELKLGLERGEFGLLYQPIFDLSNGQIVGLEALIRWNHPRLGSIGPDEFLRVAEESGLIVLIGNWALRTAMQRAAQWQSAGLGFVSINLSRRQLLQADLIPTIHSALAEFRCSPDRILLEISEELTGPELPRLRDTLTNLQQLGVRLAVDNFGTSASSLQELRRGPFQVLKIDRRFIRGVPAHDEHAGIVLSALTLGHHLGRITVAVGIETEAEKAWLAKTGCRFAQGNLLAAPLLPDHVAEILARR